MKVLACLWPLPPGGPFSANEDSWDCGASHPWLCVPWGTSEMTACVPPRQPGLLGVQPVPDRGAPGWDTSKGMIHCRPRSGERGGAPPAFLKLHQAGGAEALLCDRTLLKG